LIEESESVSIHVRRGDYVNNPKVNEYHGSLQSDYYLKAIEVINNKVSDSKFYIFSDDIEWVRDNMFDFAVFVKTTSDEEICT
jgi:virulence-associated protein VapD